MEQYWIYVIVGVIVFLIAAVVGWYCISKN
jgi:hypothetical protein